MMLMAKKTSDPKVIRPLIDGALADCVRREAKDKGIQAAVEMVRFALTERYKQLQWLRPGKDGDLEFVRE